MEERESRERELEAVEEAKKGKPKGGKLFSLVIIGVIVLVLLGGGYFVYTYIGPKFLSKENKPTTDKEKSEKAAGKLGVILPLQPFIVNLVDDQKMRYLKIKIDLELEAEDEKTKVDAEKYVPRLRDAVIMLLTSKTYGELISLEGKIQLRDEIITRANHCFGKNIVRAAYFGEFVVQ